MELKLSMRQNAYPSPGLLIVPYGIETVKMKKLQFRIFLLIVPYGIETM